MYMKMFRLALSLLFILGLLMPPMAEGRSDRPDRVTHASKKNKKKKKGKEDKEEPKYVFPIRTDLSKLNDGYPASAEKNYRNRKLGAYLPLGTMRQRMKISNYSSYENPLGIYVQSGDRLNIVLKGNPRTPIKLLVRDFGPEGDGGGSYDLQTGVNNVHVQHTGLLYVDYRDEEPDTAPQIEVSVKGGKVNGIFTHHDDENVWKAMLANCKTPTLDIMGERCQLIYNIEALREACPEQGPEMLRLNDEIIAIQHEIMGWDHFNINPGNHMMGRCQWKGFMHADGLGGAYINTAVPGLVDPERIRNGGCWALAHEFGHVDQTRPGMMWGGTQEVTNNLFSVLTNYRFNPLHVRYEWEGGGSFGGVHMRGARFDSFINSALVLRHLWQYQQGPDDGGKVPGALKMEKDSNVVRGVKTGDPFVSCCPLWQLQLYLAEARGDKYFYARIFEECRNTDESKMSHGEMRVNFMRRACDSAKLNLTEYYVQTGMLAPMNRKVEDYSSQWVVITEEMCKELLDYAEKYPSPDSSVIYYITSYSVDVYRDKLDIKPSAGYKFDVQGKKAIVPADKWENAVAFEVYKDKELIRVNLRGLDTEDFKSTVVHLPEGYTTVVAVQWDGKRYIAHSTKNERVGSDASDFFPLVVADKEIAKRKAMEEKKRRQEEKKAAAEARKKEAAERRKQEKERRAALTPEEREWVDQFDKDFAEAEPWKTPKK